MVVAITMVVMNDTATRTESVCARVRQARQKRGIGSRDLDRAAGLKEGHTAVIEGRDGDLEGDTAQRLARALRVSLVWLLSGEGEPFEADAEIPPAGDLAVRTA